MPALTKTFCKRKGLEPGRYSDRGHNLVFVVSPTGGRRWLFRYQRHGRRRELGLGPYPVVYVEEARELALELRRALLRGEDPARVLRRNRSEPTFREAAEALIDVKAEECRNAKHRQQWRTTLETYVYPRFGHVPVREVTVQHILEVLSPVWTKKTETATRLRGRIEEVLDYARAQGWRDGENPARWRGHLDQLLPKPSRVRTVRHHPALDWRQLPEFVAELRAMDGMAARALEFLILTAARSGEVRGARWREFDLDRKVWTIPAERTKSFREHKVPLGPRACELLLRQSRGDDGLVFPGAKGVMSDMTLSAVLRRMNKRHLDAGKTPWADAEGEWITVHGFRSTFRTWVQEKTEFSSELAEAALGHVVGDRTERAYRRGDALERRRELMEEWERFACQKANARRGPPPRLVYDPSTGVLRLANVDHGSVEKKTPTPREDTAPVSLPQAGDDGLVPGRTSGTDGHRLPDARRTRLDLRSGS
jgi:integrase